MYLKKIDDIKSPNTSLSSCLNKYFVASRLALQKTSFLNFKGTFIQSLLRLKMRISKFTVVLYIDRCTLADSGAYEL